MNSNKVIVMEVKDNYAIVMTPEFEFVKIKKKANMQEGQKIYIVDEDICYSNEKVPFFKNKKLMMGLGLIAILIGIILALALLNPFKDDRYAVISLDGAGSLEMELDENKNVVEATSRDDSIPDKELEYLKGEPLDDAIDHVADSLNNDSYVLAAYSIADEGDSTYSQDVKSVLQKYLPCVLFIKSDIDQLKLADSEEITLGYYKLKEIDSLEDLEACIEKTADYDRLDKFVEANSEFIHNSGKIREEIADRNNKSNIDNTNKKNNDEDDEDDEDDDDSDDDDEDDD